MRIIRRMVGFIIVAGIAAYATFIVLGNIVNAQVENDLNTIVVHDKLGVGVHHLSGMVMVQSACHLVTSRTEQLDPQNYLLTFSTVTDPALRCAEERTPRRFNLTVFAPSTGVAFQARLDGKSVPLVVIPALQ